MKRLIGAAALAVALVGGGTVAASAGDAPRNIPLSCTEHVNSSGDASVGGCHRAPRWTTRPCKEEDSVNCYWDAARRGNHTGHSFMVRRMPGDITGLVCIFYVNHKYASNHDHCAPR